MRHSLLRWTFTILTVAVMVMIFLFSSKTVDESRKESNFISLRLIRIIVKDYDELPEQEQALAMEKLDAVVRKIAHFSEFCLLAFLLRVTLECWFGFSGKPRNANKLSLQALLGGFIYACSDEFHQIFVPGRGSSISDILIDTAGVILGILLALLIIRRIRRHTAVEMSQC